MEKWKTVYSLCQAIEKCYPSTSSRPTPETKPFYHLYSCEASPKSRRAFFTQSHRRCVNIRLTCDSLTADDEDDEEMIEAVPQEEMINIPGLGPMPIRNLPQGMGELHKALNLDTCMLAGGSVPECRDTLKTLPPSAGRPQPRVQPQSDAPQEWKGLRQHPVRPLTTCPLLQCCDLCRCCHDPDRTKQQPQDGVEPACESCSGMQASTQQVFRDLLSRMGDQGRKKLTILLLGALPSSRALQSVSLHEEIGLF